MKKMSLTTKIFIGMLLGIFFGVALSYAKGVPFVDKTIIGFFLVLVGTVFVNLIKMMVVPLVFFSLTCGAAQIGDIKKLGRVGMKTLAFYLTTTAIAVAIAIIIALLIQPGSYMTLGAEALEFEAKEAPALVQVLIDMIPSNPVDSMAKGNMLQIIVFALFMGTAITILGDKAKLVKEFFEQTNEVILKIVMIVMHFAPYGVFALVARTFATFGFSAIGSLAMYMLCVLGGLLLHLLITYQGLFYAFTKLNPIQFFKKFSPAMIVAFSTSSSNATIPASLESAEKGLGIKKDLASFTIPLGATINMDGTAIMQGVATVFIAQLYGVTLGVPQFLTIILTATLASIGTAGVPGVGLVMLSMVLTQVGLPVEAIAIILGIDRILDMCRTVVNITGDAVCTAIIAKQEGELDVTVFNAPNQPEAL